MGQPAARVTDMHVCPMVTPGTPPVPHVGGPIIPPCSVNVITCSMPQARVSDKCVCVGPLDVIVKGSTTVLVNNLPAARLGDTTMHGGTIVTGAPNVLIGDAGGGSIGGGSALVLAKAANAGGPAAPGAPAAPADPAKPGEKKESPWEFSLKQELELFTYGKKGGLLDEFKPDFWTKKYGSMKDKPSEPGTFADAYDKLVKDLRKAFEVEVKYKVAGSDNELWKSKNEKVRAGVYDWSAKVGGSVNGMGDIHVGAFFEGKAAALTMENKSGDHGDLLRHQESLEVGSVSGDLNVGFKKEDGFTGGMAEAGVEASAVKVSGKGTVNLSPKSIYDNTVGAIVRTVSPESKWGSLTDAWDHGVMFGVKGEAGIAAAAKVEGKIGKIDGVFGAEAGAKLGFGPMAGLKVLVGVY